MSKRANGEGSIYRRKDGKWCAQVVHTDPLTGERARKYYYGTTRTEVRGKLKEAIARAEAGAPVSDATATVGAWLAEWRENGLQASSRKGTTRNLYATLSKTHLEPEPFGAIRLDRLRPSHIDALILELRAKKVRDKNLSDSTVRQVYTVLRAALDDAVRDCLIARNPVASVKRPKVTQAEARYLSASEVAEVLQAAKASRYYPLLALIATTGLRRGEALALKWEDIDLEAATLRVRGTLSRLDGALVVTEPKTEQSRRTLDLSPALVSLLKRHRAEQRKEQIRAANIWQDSGHVFTTETGAAVDPRNALRVLKVAANAAGVKGAVGLHTLRHSAATAMLEGGERLDVVSAVLGHHDIAITGNIYAHISEGARRSAMTRLSDAIGL